MISSHEAMKAKIAAAKRLGLQDRQGDVAEGPGDAGAHRVRGFLEAAVDALEAGDQQHHGEGQRQDGVGEDDADEAADQMEET